MTIARVERILLERGATLSKDCDQVDEYFNHPCRDFAVTDEALRLRKDPDGKMTYKGPKLDRTTKTREEIEMDIDDLDKMADDPRPPGLPPRGEGEQEAQGVCP